MDGEKIKSKKTILIPVVVVVVLAAVVTLAWFQLTKPAPVTTTASEYMVEEDGTPFVNGTGVIEANEQFDITALVTGKVMAAPFEEGGQVNEGDLLFQLDSADVENAIAKTQVGLEKAQLSYHQNADNLAKLAVTSNVTGTISALYVKEGDMVAANGKLADVVNDSVMVLKVPFIAEYADSLYPGQSAEVTLIGSFATVYGTIDKIASGHSVSADGSAVKMVEINVPNPGALRKDDKGTAVIGGIACNDAGVFDYSDTGTVIAEVAGKAGYIPYGEGDHINAGEVLVRLDSDTLTAAQEQNALAIRDAQLSLSTQADQLKNYRITAPISGTVITKNIKAGETITAAAMQKGPLATIADLSAIKFKMQVDELDVPLVRPGQSVLITADAMPDITYHGTVESVGTAGTQVSGVALYDVTVVVNDPDGLKVGMSVNAKIDVSENGETNENEEGTNQSAPDGALDDTIACAGWKGGTV